SAEKYARPSDAVRETPEGDRQRQVRKICSDIEQWKVLGGQRVAFGKFKVEEAVANREQAEQRAGHDQPNELWIAQMPPGRPYTPRRFGGIDGSASLSPWPEIWNDEDQDGDADDRERQRRHEDSVKIVRHGYADDRECHERPDQRAERVKGAVYTERSAKCSRGGRSRDQRVARRGSQAFAEPVRRDDRCDGGKARRRKEKHPAYR